MAEFGIRYEDDDPAYELMYFSELAHSRREERKKAAREGKRLIQ